MTLRGDARQGAGREPDRTIYRFVADSLGLRRTSICTELAYEIVTAVAGELKMSTTALERPICGPSPPARRQ
jgi:hypothetical protein